MGVFFGGEFFDGGFFKALEDDAAIPAGGKGDNDAKLRRRTIVKPTGLPPRRARDKSVEQRVAETREIAAEVVAEAALEFEGEVEQTPIQQMSLTDINREIGILLRKKMRTDEEEIALMLLLCVIATT